MDREKVIKGLECCKNIFPVVLKCPDCPYRKNCDHEGRSGELLNDVYALLKEQDEEHRRLLSWLGKFCRHIDNGDAWLSDEKNLAFFKEKMKQQFGWNTD